MLRLAFGVTVLATPAAMQPAQASCPTPGPMIQTGAAKLVSNPNWCFSSYGFGCYGVAAVSSTLDGFFWGQTGASGARNAGVDSGGFLIHSWTQSRPPFVGDDFTYYYNVYLVDPSYGGFLPISWDSSGIDGCISNITPATQFDECLCMILTDSWNGQGYFALLSEKSDPQGNFTFFHGNVNSWVPFGPIPRPVVTSSHRDPATGDVTFTVVVTTPEAGMGDYRSPLCNCGFGYRVYEQVVPAGSVPSSDRRACTQETLFRSTGQSIAPNDPGFIDACKAAGFGWVPALDASGTTQGFTPFGAVGAFASVRVPCPDPGAGYDVYLAAALGTNEGPGQIQFTHVGQNSFRVTCGDYQLAEPSRPRDPEAPARSAARGHRRGGRDR